MAKNNLTWSRQIEFILTLLSFAVGLGNVWRFPYLCYENGGGAFLLPYFLSLFIIGLPIFFLEISLGQFSGLQSVGCWNVVPAFRGIGYSCLYISFVLACYYNVLVALCIQYFYYSFKNPLPWVGCNKSWNKNCSEGKEAEEFYNYGIIKRSSGYGDYGAPVSNMIAGYFVAWFIVFLCLSFSIKTLGKVSYITSIFPYIMMTILVIRTALLPGSKNGIIYYLKPKNERLKDIKVWKDAATQIFFSLSTCIGGIITLSSHNKFKNNALKDAVLVALLNCATSFYVGFSVFSTCGYLAYLQKKPIDEVVQSGFGLAFVVYPTAVSKLPVSQVWSVFFFLMMMLLGFGSILSICEGILGPLESMLPNHSRKMNIIFRAIGCSVCFIVGLPCCFQGGQYLLDVVDNGINTDFIWIGIFECFAVCYVYGFKNYSNDMELMLGKKLNYYWLVTIAGTAPLLLLVILISLFADFKYADSATNTPGKVLNVFIDIAPGVITLLYVAGYMILKRFNMLKDSDPWKPNDGKLDSRS